MLTQGMSSCGRASGLLAARSPPVGESRTRPDAGMGEVGPAEETGAPSPGASSASDGLDGLGQVTRPRGASVSSSATSRGGLVNASQTLNSGGDPLFFCTESPIETQVTRGKEMLGRQKQRARPTGLPRTPRPCLSGAPGCPNRSLGPCPWTAGTRLWPH